PPVNPPVEPPVTPPIGEDTVCRDNCAELDAATQSQTQVLPPPPSVLTSQTLTVKTLAQAEDTLADIQAQTGKKPALVYVNFTVPDRTAQFTDAQFNQLESSLVSEYQTLITPKLNNAPPTLAIPPQQNYALELVVITQGEDPYRITVPQATRRDVLIATNRLLNLISKRQDGYLPFAAELYQWLIAPIEATLSERKVDSTLFFLPDGLRTLPLAALYDETEQKFVVQKDFSVGTAPSLNLVDYRYRNLNKAPVLALGATQFPEQNQTPLPGVGTELPLIQSIKGGEYLLNQDFTLQSLEERRRSNPVPIVHLATHADFLEAAPLKSYIQFYDQRLELPKWNQLDLNLPATDLLVISACNTAVGNSAVELGFGGMAVQAGVKTSVASLWPVGDIGTVGLMDGFYRNLKTASIKSEALQSAQRALLSGAYQWSNNQLITPEGAIEFPELEGQTVETLDLSHPYFWSAFMMIGSPW
ncbi:MAG: CHAT domain-containing protein, partial [Synechocystis sp.]